MQIRIGFDSFQITKLVEDELNNQIVFETDELGFRWFNNKLSNSFSKFSSDWEPDVFDFFIWNEDVLLAKANKAYVSRLDRSLGLFSVHLFVSDYVSRNVCFKK